MRTLAGTVCLALAIGLAFINAFALNGPGGAVVPLLSAAACALPAAVLLHRWWRGFAAALLVVFLFEAWCDHQDSLAPRRQGMAAYEETPLTATH